MAGPRHFHKWASVIAVVFLLVGCENSATKSALKQPRRRTAKAPASRAELPPIRFVKITTADGVRLSGRLFGKGPIGVVLGHMYPSDQNGWGDFPRVLAAKGYSVLTFDFRGYGLSGGVKRINEIDRDMLAAARWLDGRTDKLFLIGASMGGTAALKTASEYPVDGVAALSAPSEFMGLAIGGKLGETKGPKLFMAAAEDGAAAGAARRLYSEVQEPREMNILSGAAHGSDLLSNGDRARNLIFDWLERQK